MLWSLVHMFHVEHPGPSRQLFGRIEHSFHAVERIRDQSETASAASAIMAASTVWRT